MRAAQAQLDATRRDVEKLDIASLGLQHDMEKIRVTQAQASESRAALGTMEHSLKGVRTAAIEGKEGLHALGLSNQQVAQFVLSTDEMIRKVKELRNAELEAAVAARAMGGRIPAMGGGYMIRGAGGRFSGAEQLPSFGGNESFAGMPWRTGMPSSESDRGRGGLFGMLFGARKADQEAERMGRALEREVGGMLSGGTGGGRGWSGRGTGYYGNRDPWSSGAFRGSLPGGRRMDAESIFTLLGAGVSLSGPVGAGAAGIATMIPAALEGLGGSIGVLALAFHGLSAKAFTSQKAFNKLDSAQQDFVMTLKSLAGGLGKNLTGTAQGIIIPGFTQALHEAFTPASMRALSSATKDFSNSLVQAAHAWAKMFGSASFANAFSDVMHHVAGYTSDFLKGLANLASGLIHLQEAALPFTDWLDRVVLDFTKWFDATMRAQQANGGLIRFFDTARTSLTVLAKTVASLAGALHSLFNALGGMQMGLGLLTALGRVFDTLGAFLNRNQNTLSSFFLGGLAAINDVITVLQKLLDLLSPLLDAVDGVAKSLGGWRGIIDVVFAALAGKFLATKLGFIQMGTEAEVAGAKIATSMNGALGARSAGMLGLTNITAGLKNLARIGAAGIAIELLFHAGGDSGAVNYIENIAGGALAGYAIGGPAGAAVGAGFGLGTALGKTLFGGHKGFNAATDDVTTTVDYKPGSPIAAFEDGTITKIGQSGKRGGQILYQVVFVGRSGAAYIFNNLFDVQGNVGGPVSKGGTIGFVSSSGKLIFHYAHPDTGRATGMPPGSNEAGLGGVTNPVSGGGKLVGTPGQGTHNQKDWQSGNAVDVSVKTGTPIVSPVDGWVDHASPFQDTRGSGTKVLYGASITINGNDGNSYFITHLLAIAPSLQRRGAPVKKGQVIGTAGSIGHVHIAVERGNPMDIPGLMQGDFGMGHTDWGGGGGGGGGAFGPAGAFTNDLPKGHKPSLLDKVLPPDMRAGADRAAAQVKKLTEAYNLWIVAIKKGGDVKTLNPMADLLRSQDSYIDKLKEELKHLASQHESGKKNAVIAAQQSKIQGQILATQKKETAEKEAFQKALIAGQVSLVTAERAHVAQLKAADAPLKQQLAAAKEYLTDAKALNTLDGQHARSLREQANALNQIKRIMHDIRQAAADKQADKVLAQWGPKADTLSSLRRGLKDLNDLTKDFGHNLAKALGLLANSGMSVKIRGNTVTGSKDLMSGIAADRATIADANAQVKRLQDLLNSPAGAHLSAAAKSRIHQQIIDLGQTIKDSYADITEMAKEAIDNFNQAFEQETQDNVEAMTQAMQDTIDQMQQALEDQVNAMQQAMEDHITNMQITVKSAAGNFLFGGGISQTPAELALQSLQSAQQTVNSQQALTQAQMALSSAQQSGDPAAIAAALHDIAQAQYAIQEASLQKQATIQRDAATKQLAAAQENYRRQQSAQIESYRRQQQAQIKAYETQAKLDIKHYEQTRKAQEKYYDRMIAASIAAWATIGFDIDSILRTALGLPIGKGPACFPAGTLVLGPGGERPIEEYEIGDKILVWDFQIKDFVISHVVETLRHDDNEEILYIAAEGRPGVVTTLEHPFWSGSEWVTAGDLLPGDQLVTTSGIVTVEETSIIASDIPVYNLHVDHPDHNYVAAGFLVHNFKPTPEGMTALPENLNPPVKPPPKGGKETTVIHNHIYLDGKEVGKQITTHVRDELIQIGIKNKNIFGKLG